MMAMGRISGEYRVLIVSTITYIKMTKNIDEEIIKTFLKKLQPTPIRMKSFTSSTNKDEV
jgi:hypothetical protein